MTLPTLGELRAAAEHYGFKLVHRDRIRTATVSANWQKMDIHRAGEDHIRELVRRELANNLSHFMLHHNMLALQELPHEWSVEYRADLTVIGPKTPPPDSDEHFLYMPRDREARP